MNGKIIMKFKPETLSQTQSPNETQSGAKPGSAWYFRRGKGPDGGREGGPDGAPPPSLPPYPYPLHRIVYVEV